ncbi:MAG TPA: hypothetical protein VLF18_05710 [Tahibacter sp.]|nr:hypothetical protein [Tahibacter sp.]HSX59675.1 hypothetical protein [Tahibacter sp.]
MDIVAFKTLSAAGKRGDGPSPPRFAIRDIRTCVASFESVAKRHTGKFERTDIANRTAVAVAVAAAVDRTRDAALIDGFALAVVAGIDRRVRSIERQRQRLAAVVASMPTPRTATVD